MKMQMLVGNDNGNSSQKMVINEVELEKPNIYVETTSLPAGMDTFSNEHIIENLYDKLFVGIESPSIENGIPKLYYLGNYALSNTGRRPVAMDIGVQGEKLTNNLPVISTLAYCAAYAVKKAYKKDVPLVEQFNKTLEISGDMATALPVMQYNKESALAFRDKFMGEHLVTVYVGLNKIKVKVIFNYVQVLPEGTPVVFYLTSSNRPEELKQYNFKDKKIVHVAIGDGTTEYPVTDGVNFIPELNVGSDNGVGIAIETMKADFKKKAMLQKISRQNIAEYIKDIDSKYNELATALIQEPIKDQADDITEMVLEQLYNINKEADYILVYGGGSILMEEHLKNAFIRKKITKTNDNPMGVELVYINENYTTLLEARGLFEFAQSNAFKKCKEIYLSKVIV